MRKGEQFRGQTVAIVTPFTDTGEIDYPALDRLIDWHAEQGTDGRRVKLKVGLRPVTDAPILYGSASRRENLQQTVTAGAESKINATTGICNMLVDTRYSRFKMRIPAGTAWTYINGVEPVDFKATGKR